jgi:hypothetical protein
MSGTAMKLTSVDTVFVGPTLPRLHGARTSDNGSDPILDPVRVSKIAGHSNVSVTLNTYADEFDKAQHKDDLFARIERAGFGSV